MAISLDSVTQGATAYGTVATAPASNATSQPASDVTPSSATPAPAASPASYSAFSSETLSALVAAQAEEGEIYYPPAPTPPPPPPGTVFRPATTAAASSPETKLSQVLDNIRAAPANTPPAEDTSKPFSQRESARSSTQTPGVTQTQAQMMQRIASSQAGIAILQVATVAAAFNAQFSASSFNNGFSTGLGANAVSRFSSSFAFQQNRLF